MIGDDALVRASLDDWRTASLEPRLRAALAFLEKLTLTPREVGRADVMAARAAGLNPRALYELTYICFLFSTMDRLADAFAFPFLMQKGASAMPGLPLASATSGWAVEPSHHWLLVKRGPWKPSL